MVSLLDLTETAAFTALAKPVPIFGPVASSGYNCGISHSSTEFICSMFPVLLGTSNASLNSIWGATPTWDELLGESR